MISVEILEQINDYANYVLQICADFPEVSMEEQRKWLSKEIVMWQKIVVMEKGGQIRL